MTPAVLLAFLLALPAGAVEAELPPALGAPRHGVVCNGERGVCYDRLGPSVGLTEVFLGKEVAELLLVKLRESPPERGSDAVFSPAAGVECRYESGPCRQGGGVHPALTAQLFDPPKEPVVTGELAEIFEIDWEWRATRYGNDTRTAPREPERYRLRLEEDGSVRVTADCNQAGGSYRLEGGSFAIGPLRSTRAACGPDSLDHVFLRDLASASILFLREGRLYLDLKYDSGTMEFGRHDPGSDDAERAPPEG